MLKQVIYFCSLILTSPVFCQEALKYFTVKQGLTQNTVTAIFRSDDGTLWVGTQDGLNRFDGYSFSPYRHDPGDQQSLSDQYVTTIQQDKRSNIWVGTRHGLNIYRRRNNDFKRMYPDVESRNKVQSQTLNIFNKDINELVVAVASHLYSISNTDLRTTRLNQGHIDPDNIALVNGRSWQVWNKHHICSIAQCKESDHQKIKQRSMDDLYSDMVFADRHERLWHVHNKGEQSQLSIFDIKTGRWEKQDVSLPAAVNSISFDLQNKPWISTNDGVYHISADGNLSPFSIGNEKISGKVLCVYPDKEGLVWFGFADKGLALYNPAAHLFSIRNFDPLNKTVYTSLELDNGIILMGGRSGAVIYAPGSTTWTKISGKRVSASTLDGNGNIWLGTQGSGILVFNKQGKQIGKYTAEGNEITGNVIFHLRYDKDQKRVFAATRTGLSVYEEKTGKWIKLIDPEKEAIKKTFSGTYVLHTASDRDGNMWVSSNGGLDVFNADLKLVRQFSSDTDTGKISRTIVTGVAVGQDGNKWISTLSNGMYQYDGKRFYHFGMKEGLVSNVCYGVAIDQLGRIWVSTSRGVNMLEPQSGQISSFGEDDGIAIADYTISSTLATKTGMIHMGSTEGLVIVDPMQYKEDKTKLKVHLNQVLLNYDAVAIDSIYRLAPGTKVATFGFSAPAYVNASKIIYQYRLRGFENNWITLPSDNRRVTFTNLPYGDLMLELRASYHLNNMESAPITFVSIKVIPPFWRNPLFLFIILLLSFAGTVILVRWYLQKKLVAQKRKAALEQTIYKERERISRDLHDRLGAYAAAIKNNVVRLERSDRMVADHLHQLKENAEEMVMALRETIWALQLHEVTVTQLSDRFKSLVMRIAPNYPEINIEFKEEINEDKELSPSQGIQLMRIMQEALTNALKHAEASEITINIQSAAGIVVSIVDNGKGFDAEKVTRGQGLQNMEQRANEAGFELVFIHEGSGVSVVISVS